jgi:hypothetical protein
MVMKVVVAGVVGAHGVGHVLGWMPALGLARFEGTSGGSWLLTGLVGQDVTRLVAAAMFILPMVGFMAAAAGLLLGQPWWRPLAVASAAISLAAIALYPGAFPAGSMFESLAVNALVLYGIVVATWGLEIGGA